MATKLTQDLVRKTQPQDARFEMADSMITGFLLRVQPSGKKTYYVNYRLASGKRTNYRIGDADVLSIVQARDKAREVLAGVELGGDPADAKRRARECTFREFVETEYGPWLRTHKKSGAAMCDALTKAFPELHAKKLSEASGWLIEKARKRMREGGLKTASVNRYTSYLHSCFSKAVEWGFIQEHPMTRIKKEREDTSRVRYLTDEERERLMDALDAREERIRAERDSYNLWARQRGYKERPSLRAVVFADYLKPMVLLSLNTGMRRGEVFGLEWADVNFEGCILKVRAENAKSGKARHIPMNDAVCEMLTGWRAQTGSAGLVFVSPKKRSEIRQREQVMARSTQSCGRVRLPLARYAP